MLSYVSETQYWSVCITTVEESVKMLERLLLEKPRFTATTVLIFPQTQNEEVKWN